MKVKKMFLKKRKVYSEENKFESIIDDIRYDIKIIISLITFILAPGLCVLVFLALMTILQHLNFWL